VLPEWKERKWLPYNLYQRFVKKVAIDYFYSKNSLLESESKVFRGDANLTIESMVKLSRAVECNLDIALRSRTEKQPDYPIIKKYLIDKTI